MPYVALGTQPLFAKEEQGAGLVGHYEQPHPYGLALVSLRRPLV